MPPKSPTLERSESLETSISNASARAVGKGRSAIARVGRVFGRPNKKAAAKHADAPDQAEHADDADASDGAFNPAGAAYDPALFSTIREGWVRRHMALRRGDYTRPQPLSLTAASWNVAGKKPPPPSELRRWIEPARDGCDLLAIGLQEAVELVAANIGAGASGPLSGNAAAWEAAITAEVCAGADGGDAGGRADGSSTYSLLCSRQMMGVVLLLYAKSELRRARAVSPPRLVSVGTGLLGVVGHRTTHGALPHRAPSTRCTAESMHHVWHRWATRARSAAR